MPSIELKIARKETAGRWSAFNRQKIDNLKPFQVDETVMARAYKSAIFLHCLPAKRGLEVSAGVLESKHSVVFDAAENRLHTQKAVLLWCLAKSN